MLQLIGAATKLWPISKLKGPHRAAAKGAGPLQAMRPLM